MHNILPTLKKPNTMKKLIIMVAAIVSLTCTTATAITATEDPAPAETAQNGWETIREKVSITTFTGHMKSTTTAGPLQRDSEGSLRISFGGRWYSVMRSNRDGYSYMFYTNSTPHYFN